MVKEDVMAIFSQVIDETSRPDASARPATTVALAATVMLWP